ncbi:MAG: MFS transporter [Actinobacteria bacterium]|nr:MFS transporter [Actinomycetota bacterium]
MNFKIKIVNKFFSAFPALQHKNYRLYFFGQLISLIGTWLQMVALGWLVLQITQSAFLVGLVSTVGNLPVLVFTLFGGVIVDRLPKRNILFFTQISSMILALILGLLTVFRIINISEIFVLAFLLGLVNALDSPARQSFIVEMVGRKDLSSAIALNSGIFNGARVIGPAFAGITIALFGTGGAFIINGLCYIAIIIAILFIKVNEVIPETHPHPLKAIHEGLHYSFTHPVIGQLLIFTAFSSIFGWSYSIIMPVFVKDVFQMGADSLGYFYSAVGIGALTAILLISALSRKVKSINFILTGNIIFLISITFFTFTRSIYLALPLLFFAGIGLIMQFSIMNTVIQHVVSNHIRGRVMSIYTLMFMGMLPVSSFQVGFFAEHFGPQIAVRINVAILLIFSIFLFVNRLKIQSEYEKHMVENSS